MSGSYLRTLLQKLLPELYFALDYRRYLSRDAVNGGRQEPSIVAAALQELLLVPDVLHLVVLWLPKVERRLAVLRTGGVLGTAGRELGELLELLHVLAG